MFYAVLLCLFLRFLAFASASKQIVSGATWTAAGTSEHVQAHGGGIIEVEGVYYWVGENKLDGSHFQSINCYSSTDLVSWTFVSELLSLQKDGDLGPSRVVERPHILYNKKTKLYVMWMHIDSADYTEAKAGVATSPSVCGRYTYKGASRPLGFLSRDIGLFKDTDDTGYLLTEDRQNGIRIDRLSSDYTSVKAATFVFTDQRYLEASNMYKSPEGVYFMFASHQSGWDPNDNIYSTARDLSGPWSDWTEFVEDKSRTYYSQTSAIVDINGVVMYMGDRWNATNLMASSYVWLPLNITGTNAQMAYHDAWILKKGHALEAPPTTTLYASSPYNELLAGAKVRDCLYCSQSTSVGWIGGSSSPGGKLTFPHVWSQVTTTTTIQIMYTNSDVTQRFATVIVNGEAQKVAFLPTTSKDKVKSAVVTVKLKEGNDNVVTIEGADNSWGPDIDRLIIPVS